MDGTVTDRYGIAARMERLRLPLSPWHHKLRPVVGSVNCSDAFDASTRPQERPDPLINRTAEPPT